MAAAAAILAPLIVPFLSLDLGQEDIGATPKSTTERQAYDLMAAGFGVGYNGPLLVAAEVDPQAKPSSEFENQKTQASGPSEAARAGADAGAKPTAAADPGGERADPPARPARAAAAGARAAARHARAGAGEPRATGKGAVRGATRAPSDEDRLQEQQGSLTTQLNAAQAEAKKLVREGARLARALVGRAEVGAHPRRRASGRGPLRRDPRPPERTRLEARLRGLERREDQLQRELERVMQQEQALRTQSEALVATLQRLRQEEADVADEAGALGADAVALAKQAETVVQRKQTLVEQAADLQVQAANLQVQAADLQTQAANLQTQKVEPRGSSRRRASNSRPSSFKPHSRTN